MGKGLGIIDIKKNYRLYLYFGIISAVFLFTRLYHITSVPSGMHIDEISMGYNTWALSEYGADRYNVSFPVYFNNAGSGQSSLYVYIAVVFAKLFGYSLFTLRLVSVLFGIMLLVFGTMAAYEVSGLICAEITAFFITIMPFFIMSERWAFDCNAMLPTFVMALYFFIKLLKTKKTKYAVLTGIAFSLTLYSYILAFIVAPVFFVAAVLYCLAFRQISIKNIMVIILSGFICSVPIILYIMVLLGVLPEFNIGPVSVTAASAGRISELSWQGHSLSYIFNSLKTLTTYDDYNFTANEKYGIGYMNAVYIWGHKFYIFPVLLSIALAVAVASIAYRLVKCREFSYELLMVIYIIAGFVPVLFLEHLVIYRHNVLFYAFVFLIAYMFYLMWRHKMKIICGLFLVLFLYDFGSYSLYLFGGGMLSDCRNLKYFDEDLLGICREFDFDKYDAIYVDDTTTHNAGLVISYGLRIPPYAVEDEIKNMDEDNMVIRNVHIGIPKVIIPEENAIYIIGDINTDTYYYINTYEPIDFWERLINNNKIKQRLMESGSGYEKYNNYYILKAKTEEGG